MKSHKKRMLHNEIVSLIKDIKWVVNRKNFKKVKRCAKLFIEINRETPCENCDNMYCKDERKAKIFYCREQR